MSRRIEYTPIGEVVRAPRNVKGHAKASIARSFDLFGFVEPIVVDERTGRLVAGHGRLDELQSAAAAGGAPPDGINVGDDGRWLVPVVRGWSSGDDAEAEAYLLASNRITELGGWDEVGLAEILRDMDAALAAAAGFSTADLKRLIVDDRRDQATRTLRERFVVPPFSVLDARQGYWQDRKRAWLDLGIRSSRGRGEELTVHGPPAADINYMSRKNKARKVVTAGGTPGAPVCPPDYGKQKRRLTFVQGDRTNGLDEVSTKILERGSGTSIFDPVLCEVAYRWFAPPDAVVLDPFAGGSVRGLVAAWLGRTYVGVDLSEDQIDANRAQAKAVLGGEPVGLEWILGDSYDVVPSLGDSFDLVFSCPPYFDLERYTDDPADLSNLPWAEFLARYRAIIAASVLKLRDDRFAVWVVGEIRDKKGFHRGLVSESIRAFADAGMALYNEAVLVTAVSSLPLRAGRQFAASRKLGRTHQSVLVFVKGSPAAAVAACGPVEVEVPPEETVDESGVTP